MAAPSWLPKHLSTASSSFSPSQNLLVTTVIPNLLDAISEIGKILRQSHQVSLTGGANTFGDDQLNVDVSAENAVRAALAKCPSVVTASSEEDPVERPVVHTTTGGGDANVAQQFTVAFDPLDGSSIIGPNWTVGTIIGIWQGESALGQVPRDKQIAAILGIYGPRTTAIVALREPGQQGSCFEIGLGEDGLQTAQLVREIIRLASPPYKTKYFAPANLRAAAEDEWYMSLVTSYISKKYTLRYSGGLVPDIVHSLSKGHGIYISPVTSVSKAKLRKLYELYPIALIVECAGGNAIDGETKADDILSKEALTCDERGGIICGNKEEIAEILGGL
ncbi:SED(1,7)P2ase [Cladobotryum mycophilum]|uniref:SED(1,7)P2ase n=1 Tax=Cladobotryum mycophilum TaxID=491253 RepID=A0ABR0SUQ3_9HYPO